LPDGSGAGTAMKKAINMAGITGKELSYINAHGTSTPANDLSETKAIKYALEETAYEVPISSTKSYFRHLFGGAGSTEAIVCIQALRKSFIAPPRELINQDPDSDLDYVPLQGRKQQLNYALSKSLGFGGHNCSLLITRW